jgi:uncharacterized protein YndB with AHSA1/START domain
MTQRIEKTVTINAPASAVWDALTLPHIMKQWMAEPDVHVDIVTDWNVGGPISIRGVLSRVPFENRGTVLQWEPMRLLRYSHLSSLSRLPDRPENYSIFEFRLTPLDERTSLVLTIENFPTEVILRHLDFYWRTTVEVLKKMIENAAFRRS